MSFVHSAVVWKLYFKGFHLSFFLMIILINRMQPAGHPHEAIVFIDRVRVLLPPWYFTLSLIMPIMLWLRTHQP